MLETDSADQPQNHVASKPRFAPLRPARTVPTSLDQIAKAATASAVAGGKIFVHGVSLDSRSISPGDLYIALPGAHVHGARFAAQAIANGARAILTDVAGAALIADPIAVPLIVSADPRAATGAVAALIYRSVSTSQGTESLGTKSLGIQSERALELFAVTGTNGKTTTTYFLNSLLRALDKTTGLIGTIEILAGDEPIPSRLTTPESTEVHGLLALMRERGIEAASMEVSSHALAFGRVDHVQFNVAGFTNLTQDHLDLHGDMNDYFSTKAQLFTPQHAQRAVIVVDDQWGEKLVATASVPVSTLATKAGNSGTATWRVANIVRQGIGSSFVIHGPHKVELSACTALPGDFNVSNAALATVMVAEHLLAGAGLAAGSMVSVNAGEPATENVSGIGKQLSQAVHATLEHLRRVLKEADPFTIDVPGRMQLVGTAPVAVVDFAHNPDALERALNAVRSPEKGSRVIVVFGATGERDVTKRPIMGAIAAQHADVVIITDDDPHDEEPAGIRASVLAGAMECKNLESLDVVIEESGNRADAIRRAVEIAKAMDTILVAGRGHEVFQEVSGVNVALDDRVELRQSLVGFGFPVVSASRIGS